MAIERIEKLTRLPKRPKDSHKGLYGTVLAFAGGRGSAGAAGLVGASALRSGAGLARVLCPREIQPTVASFEPCYMTYPVPDDDDGLARLEPSKKALERFLPSATVLAMGPGLGQSDDLGEFSRLTGLSIAEIQADRETHAVAFAAKFDHLILVLKGSETIVTDGVRLYVNTTGNPGMATGGSGDVLTGVIAAMIAQKLDPFDAACFGVYAHGLAGDIARDQNGEVGLIAGDIVDSLADAFHHLGE